MEVKRILLQDDKVSTNVLNASRDHKRAAAAISLNSLQLLKGLSPRPSAGSPLDYDKSSARFRERFRTAVNTVISQRRFLAFFGGGIEDTSSQVEEIKEDEQSFLLCKIFYTLINSVLKSQRSSNADAGTNRQIKSILLSSSRSLEDTATLEKLTSKLPAFGKFTIDQRFKICECMFFCSNPSGRVVAKEGRSPMYFYFVLSGQCEVFQVKQGKRVRMNVINSGESIADHNSLGFFNTYRSASVACATDVEFLCVEKDDYEQIILGHETEEEIRSKRSLLSSIHLFRSIEPASSQLNEIVDRSKIRYFELGASILTEGEENSSIYFIISGDVKLLKLVPISIPKKRKYLGPRRSIKTAPLIENARGKTPGGGLFPPISKRPHTTKVLDLDLVNPIDPIFSSNKSIKMSAQDLELDMRLFQTNTLSAGKSFPELATEEDAQRCGFIMNELESTTMTDKSILDGYNLL
jgi:CRP-like cAMP-binding protein